MPCTRASPSSTYHVPKAFVHEGGKLHGHDASRSSRRCTTTRAGASWCPPASRTPSSNATRCWWRWARRTRFPWIERDCGIDFDEWGLPKLDKDTFQSTVPNVFFGGDAAFGPKNIITAVAHGHEAAVSIDRLLQWRGRSACAPRR